ncbi:precorrin-6y C5,15-methyltransferase (decarboxylating) subunit CbiE [Actinomadura kijaniata]|uniref:precorrin-6y C5,15-methyltransferase (decarboxylating) subunit CbiE n=1 Tax=Actinomadura kijaniata TaxID=46161 RepID=UPI003F1B028E
MSDREPAARPAPDGPPVVVVGIGADGWTGLADDARRALRDAEVVFGGPRQLALLPGEVTARHVPWPSPMLPALPGLFDEHAGRRIAVLASGDPMFHGVGGTLARLLGPARLRVLPHPSSVSLACARLGWPLEDTEVVSAVGRPLETLHRVLAPGRRVLVLSADAATPARVAALLAERGHTADLTVLERLGAPGERVRPLPPGGADDVDPLNIVAVHCRAGDPLPLVPGLPDDAYDHDGQLTKREVRALTLARLAPTPGALLWDVGAGSGSIGIEWMRAHPSCRAVAVEHHPGRAARVTANAAALGVPGLRLVEGRAPEALHGLPAPDAVFVGGGATVPGVVETCWRALRPGGRLVVNAVTLETERLVGEWRARVGGDLTRIQVSRAAPVGGFTGWRTMMPVTTWTAVKGEAER